LPPATSTVLLVDDDLENLWALQLALESSRHHVVMAESGPEALQKLQREVPRLIVTDWQMPGMDGSELCRRVRSQPALAELPIVLLSAMPEPANELHCWTLFFRKPVDLDALLSAVSTLIAERLGNDS
jgi:CheY-like chemotaxis protein